jgi:hypothetical protein
MIILRSTEALMSAKKRTVATDESAAAGTRKEPYSAERLRKRAERLKAQAAEFAAFAKAMEKSGVAEVKVDGHGMLNRAVAQIERFLSNVKRELAGDED